MNGAEIIERFWGRSESAINVVRENLQLAMIRQRLAISKL
jgi:hypothetical protein